MFVYYDDSRHPLSLSLNNDKNDNDDRGRNRTMIMTTASVVTLKDGNIPLSCKQQQQNGVECKDNDKVEETGCDIIVL